MTPQEAAKQQIKFWNDQIAMFSRKSKAGEITEGQTREKREKFRLKIEAVQSVFRLAGGIR